MSKKREYTQEELFSKYNNIESKIPSCWPNYMMTALNLRKDLELFGRILTPESEIYRVIGLLHKYDPIFFNKYINPDFEYMCLYPTMMKEFNIKPDTK